MPEIINIVKHYVPAYDLTQWSLVTDRNPDFVYKRDGNLLLAEDDGWFDALEIRPGTKDAFAGREFDIRLEGGGVYHCAGHVWSVSHPRHGELFHCGSATMADLKKCYVFCTASVLKNRVDEWLSRNDPFIGYREFGKVVLNLKRQEASHGRND